MNAPDTAQPAVPRLCLLGSTRLLPPDSEIDIPLQYRKGWALLGYLAVERGRRHGRDQLASFLWPFLDTTAARTNLRQVLTNLQQVFRRLGHPELIHADKTSIGLLPTHRSDILFDIDLLDPLIIDEADVVQMLNQQVAWQHRGLFLDGLNVAGSPEFEDWLEFTRDHFLRREIRLMCQLREHHRSAGRLALATDIGWRITKLDGWNEEHYRQLMLILSEDGAQHMLARVYADLERTLRKHLDCEPSAQTRALLEQLGGTRQG